MSKVNARTVIGVKQETTQNTNAVLAATNYALAQNVTIKPNIQIHKRDFKRASLDTLSHVTGQRFSEVSYELELKGSGVAGTANQPLVHSLEACGFLNTNVPGTSDTLNPVSVAASGSYFGAGKSVTIEIYKDGRKHFVTGGIGTAKLVYKAGGIAFAQFTMKGTYQVVTETAFPSVTYLATLPPVASSQTLTLLGLAATHIAANLEVDVGNEVSLRDDFTGTFGVRGFQITSREPSGSIDPEAVAVAVDDVWQDFAAGVEASTSLTLGATAGNIITLTLPKTQYRELSYGERNGLLTDEIGLSFNQNTGDDWMSLAFT